MASSWVLLIFVHLFDRLYDSLNSWYVVYKFYDELEIHVSQLSSNEIVRVESRPTQSAIEESSS